MSNINWAPYIGAALLLIGVVAALIPGVSLPGGSAEMLIGLGMATLGVHDTVVKAGRIG